LLIIAPHISWNPVDGELALFDGRTGAYHALNPSGAAIWRAIAAGSDEAEAVETLAATVGAPRETIAADVRAFIADALARELLVESPA
jgi:hypothetical protein